MPLVCIQNMNRTMDDGVELRDGVIIRKQEPQMPVVAYWEGRLDLLELEEFTEYNHIYFWRALRVVQTQVLWHFWICEFL